MCAGGSMGDSKDIRFMGSPSLCISVTSSCLIVFSFVLCGISFWLGFVLGLLFGGYFL
jgi:hypothetical protein